MLRTILLGFSLIIVAAAVAVGPFGIVAEQPPAEDSADVTVESAPTDTIALERGRFGSGRYHIDAPPVVVTVANVTGAPTLRYTIDIPAEGLVVTSHYDLAGRRGRLRMGPSTEIISPDRISQRRYNATVSVWLRTGTYERALVQREITVEVRP